MNQHTSLLAHLSKIEQTIKYTFENKQLLINSFTHRSYLNEHKEFIETQSYERLEFVGDSIIGMLFADFLYDLYPDKLEGELTKLRSVYIDKKACSYYISDLNLTDHLLLGNSVRKNFSQAQQNLTGDLCESLIGAVYKDQGFECCKQWFWQLFGDKINSYHATGKNKHHNYISLLQEHFQQFDVQVPTYKEIDRRGPDHSPEFKYAVSYNSKNIGSGWGKNKKSAKQSAAQDACKTLNLV